MIYTIAHAHDGWLMGKQAGQGDGRKEDGWALPRNTKQGIRDVIASQSGPENTNVSTRHHQDTKTHCGYYYYS